MEWKTSYVVYRISAKGTLEEVYHTDLSKKAKYWMNYIALPGDMLCRTPIDPKHSKQTKMAEYVCHKIATKSTSTDRAAWESMAKEKNFDNKFPEEALTSPAEQ